MTALVRAVPLLKALALTAIAGVLARIYGVRVPPLLAGIVRAVRALKLSDRRSWLRSARGLLGEQVEIRGFEPTAVAMDEHAGFRRTPVGGMVLGLDVATDRSVIVVQHMENLRRRA